MKPLLPLLYRWHQKIGFYVALLIISWGLSGLAHPIISRLNPKPVAFVAPAEAIQLSKSFSLTQLLDKHGINEVQRLRIFNWQGVPTLRILHSNSSSYFNLNTLEHINNGESKYAHYLARHYSGDVDSAIKSTSQLSDFSSDYHYINRLLPITRVDLERADGLRVYVDTDSGRLGTLSDDRKYITATLFRNLHSLVFIESIGLRTTVMIATLTLGFLISAVGLWLYIALWRNGRFKQNHDRIRRWHRSMGAFVALAAMGFCFSGALHAWYKFANSQQGFEASNSQVAQNYSAQSLRLTSDRLNKVLAKQPISDIQLVTLNDSPSWRLQIHQQRKPQNHQHHHGGQKNHPPEALQAIYLNATTLDVINQGEAKHATYLAKRFFSGNTNTALQQTTEPKLITRFGGEYGFVNKRLPVYKIDFDLPGNPTVYVENSTNTLAAAVDNSARLEGLSFAYIHKWHHLDFLGKTARDSISAFFALGIVAMILMGIWRYALAQGWVKKKRRSKLVPTESN